MDQTKLKNELSNSINTGLASQLIAEHIAIEEAFSLRHWGYAELNGGRFAEVAARVLYSVDSGNLSLTKSVDDCLKYIENNQVSHAFPEPAASRHLAKVIRSIYKLRSQRGAVHVSHTYTANEIDSRLVVESVRWVLAELVRIFIVADTGLAEEIVRKLAQFQHPIIRLYDGKPFVQATHLSTEDEILVQLMFSDTSLSTPELVKLVHRDPSGIRRSIKKLASTKVREITGTDTGWHITDLGVLRAEAALLSER